MSGHDSIFASTFDTLTSAMGVPHCSMPTPSQKTRIEWAWTGAVVPGAAPWRRHGEKTVARDGYPHTVTIFAPSQAEVQRRLKQFRGALDRVCGPPQGGPALGTEGDDDYVSERPGYEIKAGKLAGAVGGDGTASGYACDVQVTLYDLAASHIHPPATVTATSVSVVAEDADDGDTETGVTWPA